VFFTCGWYVQKWGTEVADLVEHDTQLANQVSQDWDRPQFTDFIVTDWPHCPADYPEVVFKREF